MKRENTDEVNSMKKVLFIPVIAILCLLFCSCQPERGESDVKTETKSISVTVRNDVEEADIWILPQTAQNLKTTVWGAPTFSKVKAGEQQSGTIQYGEAYIIRIIDVRHAYYAANDIVLSNNNTVHFRNDASENDAAIIILDEKGTAVSSAEHVFQGSLGAR